MNNEVVMIGICTDKLEIECQPLVLYDVVLKYVVR